MVFSESDLSDELVSALERNLNVSSPKLEVMIQRVDHLHAAPCAFVEIRSYETAERTEEMFKALMQETDEICTKHGLIEPKIWFFKLVPGSIMIHN